MTNITGFPIETIVREHLVHNHYPPLPADLTPYAVRAIEMLNDGEDGPITIYLNEDADIGTLLDGFGNEVTASDFAEEVHLWGFVDAGRRAVSVDYDLDDFPPGEDGYYRVYYGGADSAWAPDGPYGEYDRPLYDEAGDYPRDGYIVYFDGVDGVTSVPSLPGLDS